MGLRICHIISNLRHKCEGAMAVITAICLTMLAGAIAIAVEVGGYMNMATQLQHAADASALAGVGQLDKQAGAIARAQTAATGALVNNSQSFANDGDADGSSVVVENADITFYSSLNPKTVVNPADAGADANAAFIEVNVSPRTVNYAFAALNNTTSSSVGARAVAGMGQAICKVPPMMMCNPAETEFSTDFDPSLYTGRGIILKSAGNGSPWAPGNFGLLALDNHNLSTNDIRDAMGKINPEALCYSADGEIGSKPGESTAVAQGFNVRFDIYQGATGSLDNNSQYAPAPNAIKGMVKNGSSCAMSNSGWDDPDNPYEGPNDPDSAEAMPLPRDNCAYTAYGAPGGCTVDPADNRIGDGVWDIGTYTDVNHPGTNWMTELGTNTPTRYEVYQWELSGNIVNNGFEDANPVCNTQTPDPGPDRRVISIAVVNCLASGVTGQTPNLDVEKWIEVLITEPMRSDGAGGGGGGNNYLYGEIIGEAGAGTAVETTVQLLPLLIE